MTYAFCLTGLTWFSLMLEQAFPDLFPYRSIILPVVIVGMLWDGTSRGILVGGGLLVVDWIIRPAGPPLLPVILSTVIAVFMTRRHARNRLAYHTGRRRQLPDWSLPVLLLLMAAGVLTITTWPDVTASFPVLLPRLALFFRTSVPVCILLTAVMLLTSEPGWRRIS